MSGIPDQDSHIQLSDRLYTPDDVQHLIAREVAKQQMAEIKAGLLDTNKKLLEVVSTFNAEIKALRELMAAAPIKVDECRADMRREIERDFQTAISAERMEHRIEDRIDAVDAKVDKQWLKITVVLGTLSSLITGIGVAVNYWLMVSKIVNGG